MRVMLSPFLIVIDSVEKRATFLRNRRAGRGGRRGAQDRESAVAEKSGVAHRLSSLM